jgi:prostaglandin-endoperoxide synthase 2
LLSEHIWGDPANQRLAFTDAGIAVIKATKTLRDVLARNVPHLGDGFIGMTREEWERV